MKHLAILISIIILKSCGSSKDVVSLRNTTDMTTNEIISGAYILEELNTTNVTDNKLILEFDSKTNKVSGFAGCNRFFGTYSTVGNTISFSELGATRMMCQEDANKIEGRMFKALAEVSSFELSKGKLSLKKDETVLIKANETVISKSRQGEMISIAYRASTRGFFEKIWIEGNVLKYTNDRDLKEINIYKLSDEQVSELMVIYKDLDLKAIPSLEPPSKTFQYDAAAMATLEIIEGENIYSTKGFDHGNPPEGISLLVNKVLSIKETMVKQ